MNDISSQYSVSILSGLSKGAPLEPVGVRAAPTTTASQRTQKMQTKKAVADVDSAEAQEKEEGGGTEGYMPYGRDVV